MPKAKGPGAPLSMADRDGWIWYDGKLVEWRSATTHVLTHSLHYGLAVFEGVRAYKTAIGTAIYRLKEHTDRLFNSAHIYMMKIPFTRDQIMKAQLEADERVDSVEVVATQLGNELRIEIDLILTNDPTAVTFTVQVSELGAILLDNVS